ncbi:MAG: protein kinase [Ktedonobacteraceae bacterium]
MICPRCGNEWDASKSPCTRCGLAMRVQGQSGPLGRTASPPQNSGSQQSGGLQSLRPQSSGSSGSSPQNMAYPQNMRPQSPNSMRGSNALPRTPMPTPPPFSTAQAQHPPFNVASVPVTEPPRSSTSTNPPLMPGFEDRVTSQPPPKRPEQPNQRQAFNQVSPTRSNTDPLTSRGVPQRPQSGASFNRSMDSFIPEVQRNSNPPRPSRLVTDPLAHDPARVSMQSAPSMQQSSPYQQNGASSAQNNTRSMGAGADTRQLTPGTILRGGRYRLHELQEQQDWLSDAYETMWVAQDAQRGASQVMICEVFLPDSSSMIIQAILRSATMALTSVGRHPHIATLSDAFSDRGRHFFVFDPVEGESLLSRMRRTGRAMQEQEVIECCLQMTEVLELLSQQPQPLVHGLIRPEHIIVGRSGAQYVLSNFSIVLAGGATQFVSGIDRTHLSAYSAPELVRGVIDVRTDLYSLLATAYHAVTGSLPSSVSGSIPSAQRLNPNISPAFDAVLSKGLRPIANQRYQRPSELRQELLAIRSVSGTLIPSSGQRMDQSVGRIPDLGQGAQRSEPTLTSQVPNSVAQAFQSLAPEDDFGEQKLLLPLPEELPPLEAHNDTMHAAIWLGSLLICLILVVVFSRGFF